MGGRMRTENGFTLLELMIVTIIIGILASSVTYSVGDFVADKRSEQYAVGLFSELCTYRALAIREDRPILVQFNTTAPDAITYSVNINEDEDYDPSSGNNIAVPFRSFDNSGNFGLGLPTASPSTGPPGQGFTTSENILGEWKTHNLVGSAGAVNVLNTIVFENDGIGSMSSGVIYIKNVAIPKHGYAIVKAADSNILKLWKWGGNKWYEL
jgi:prepilin-type N-terminal cleavage/methylation domain-containing protein